MNLYNFEFIIPLKRDDLLTSQTSEQYYVSEVYHYNELEQKIVGELFILFYFFIEKAFYC